MFSATHSRVVLEGVPTYLLYTFLYFIVTLYFRLFTKHDVHLCATLRIQKAVGEVLSFSRGDNCLVLGASIVYNNRILKTDIFMTYFDVPKIKFIILKQERHQY
uniref:Uncharacterized protein n=1 Tax=Pararge aegeria TaxID=116150 RepID=S4PLS7_9NEOP